MAFGFTKTKLSPIGIDFGADSLKVLQVVENNPPQLVAAACAPVPEHARTEPLARSAFYLEALKTLLHAQPFKGKRAVCSLPAYQTLVQHLQVTRVEGSSIEDQVGLLLRQRLNIDPSRMVMRNFVLDEATAQGASRQEVICVAASRDAIMRHVETAHRAKLDVVGMHDEPSAIVRAFTQGAGKDDPARTTCYIDIGAATTKVVIAHGSQMVFAKTIHAAGDHLTREAAGENKVSFTEARQARIEMAGSNPVNAPAPARGRATDEQAVPDGDAGYASNPSGHGSGTLTTATPKTRPVLLKTGAVSTHGSALGCLIDELQMCVRYHQSLFNGRAIEKLVFLGGEARHLNNCQSIARSLRIGAQLGDPMARLVQLTRGKIPTGVDFEQPQPGWAVALGLCLSPTGE